MIRLKIQRIQLLLQQFQLWSGNSLEERLNEQKTMGSIKGKHYICTHLYDFITPEHLIWNQETTFFSLGHVSKRMILQQLEFQLFKVHSSNSANKAAKQKNERKSLIGQSSLPCFPLASQAHCAQPVCFRTRLQSRSLASRLCWILATVHQEGRHAFAGGLVTLLFSGSPEWKRKLELLEGVHWNTLVWTRDTQGWKCLACKLQQVTVMKDSFTISYLAVLSLLAGQDRYAVKL